MNPNYTEFKFPQVRRRHGSRAAGGAGRGVGRRPTGRGPRAPMALSSPTGAAPAGALLVARGTQPANRPRPRPARQIKAHPWAKVFSKRMPADAVDLVRGGAAPCLRQLAAVQPQSSVPWH